MHSVDFDQINPHILRCGSVSKANCSPAGTDYGSRCVNWQEIELITWGEGEIITEGVHIPARKGNIFFRSPGMRVKGIAPYYCYIVVFDLSYDQSKSDLYADKRHWMDNDNENATFQREGNFCGLNFPDVFATSRFEQHLELIKNICGEWLFQGNAAALHTKSLLLQMIDLAFEEYSAGTLLKTATRSIHANYPRVAAAREAIDNNPAKWFTLAELADIAGISRNFFCKIFRDIVGMTPIEYINRQKISAAKKRLIETDESTKAIAAELGFENITYFYTMFKSKTGLTPMDYRQRQHSTYQTFWQS